MTQLNNNNHTTTHVIGASVIRTFETAPPPQSPETERSAVQAATDSGKASAAAVKQSIIGVLEAAGGGMLTREILAACPDLNHKSVRTQLTRMARSGVLKTILTGKYRDGNIWHMADVTPSATEIRAKTSKAREIKYNIPRSGKSESEHHTATFSVADNGDITISVAESRLTLDPHNIERLVEFIAWSKTRPRKDRPA